MTTATAARAPRSSCRRTTRAPPTAATAARARAAAPPLDRRYSVSPRMHKAHASVIDALEDALSARIEEACAVVARAYGGFMVSSVYKCKKNKECKRKIVLS